MKPIRSILLIFRKRLGHKKDEKLAAIYRKNKKMQKSKDPKTVRAFLAGISLPEPVTMAKSSTAVYSFVKYMQGVNEKHIFFV